MTFRLASIGIMASGAMCLLASPVFAWEWSQPVGNVGLEAAYDDHISGRATVDQNLYPLGNADWRSVMGLGVNEDLAFDPTWGMDFGARFQSNRFVSYPEFDSYQGAATVEFNGYALPGDLDLYADYVYSSDFTFSQTQSLSLCLARPLFLHLVATGTAGYFRYDSTLPGLPDQGPFGDLELDYHFPFDMTLSLGSSYMERTFQGGRLDSLLGFYLTASQRFMQNAYLNGTYSYENIDSTDPASSFPDNSFSLGTSYFF